MPGVGAVGIACRRKSGALIDDAMELDEYFHGRRVVACYGAMRS